MNRDRILGLYLPLALLALMVVMIAGGVYGQHVA